MVVVGQYSLMLFLNTGSFGSKPVYAGTFDFGEVGDTAYSLNIDLLHRAFDEAFDVMMQYGDEEVHHIIQYDYQKFGSSFHVPIGEAGGGHQRLGIKSEDTSYYVTDCGDVYAFYIQSSCYYTNYHVVDTCGFGQRETNTWINCSYGDNIRRQRSFIRYDFDKDDEDFLQRMIMMIWIPL